MYKKLWIAALLIGSTVFLTNHPIYAQDSNDKTSESAAPDCANLDEH